MTRCCRSACAARTRSSRATCAIPKPSVPPPRRSRVKPVEAAPVSAEQFDHAMGDADALMWNIERDPQLRSTIVAMLVLDSPPKWKRVLERLERGTQLIPRLRQRVIEPAVRLGPPMWSADPDFDLSYHARRVRLPKPRRHEDVLEIVGRAAMGDFDRARPLWECTLVEGLPDGRAAFVLKVHHSMTDGVGGMRLMLMLFDLERDALDDATEVDPMPLPMFSPLGMLSATLEWQARRAADGAQRGLDAARAVLQRLRDDAPGALDDAAKTINSVARFLAPAPAPMSPLLAERSLDRRVTTTRFPLDDLKAAANAVGGTVNDAFVAAVLGGLRRY